MNWSKSADAFCLRNKISGCAKLLLQWLVRNKTNCEPDLKSFNNWAAKHRDSPYHRDTLKQAFKKLVNAGVILIKKFFKWHVSRIELVFLWERKKSRSQDCDLDSHPYNPYKSAMGGLQQQPLSKEQQAIIQNLKIAGIHFEDYAPLWAFSPEEIDRAVTYYLQYPSIKDIRNPAGWLLKCLQKKWYASTFLDVSLAKPTEPHLIAFVWDRVKDYVKACVGGDTESTSFSLPPPVKDHLMDSSPPPVKDHLMEFLEPVIAVRKGEKTWEKRSDGIYLFDK